MDDERKKNLGREGLPGKLGQNREEQEPAEPVRRRPHEAEDGDKESGGEAGEGSQSTGHPGNAG